MLTPTKELCRYTLTDSGIHHYELLDPTKAGIDDWLLQMSDIPRQYNNRVNTSPVLILIDTRNTHAQSGTMNYSFQAVQKWLRENPRNYTACVAVVMGNNFLISVADLLLRSMRFNNTLTRLFRSNDYPKAVEWLNTLSRAKF